MVPIDEYQQAQYSSPTVDVDTQDDNVVGEQIAFNNKTTLKECKMDSPEALFLFLGKNRAKKIKITPNTTSERWNIQRVHFI